MRRFACSVVFAVSFLATAAAQELEPGAYSVSPVGVNILVVSNNLSGGDINFDPTLPVENATAKINATSLGYVRTLDLLGRSASLGFIVPFTVGHLEGLYLSEFTEVDRAGLRDPFARVAVNLYGAPAMDLKEFASYQQRTNVGVSLVVGMPLGEYDPSRLINLGSNRWSFKPEIGLSKAFSPWTFELYGGVWLFTDNENFLEGQVRKQDPIGTAQVHILRTFKPRLWVAFDANFYAGGRTKVGDRLNLDLQRNSRVGVTVSVPLDPRQSVKFAYSRGAYTTIGADFHAVVAAYQYLWGAGL